MCKPLIMTKLYETKFMAWVLCVWRYSFKTWNIIIAGLVPVQFGSRKKLPCTSLQCCSIFWSFGVIDFGTFKCWKMNTTQAGAMWLFHTDSIKPSLQISCYYLVLMLSRDYFLSRYLYITTERVKADVKTALCLN
jgi:hypothetical protein